MPGTDFVRIIHMFLRIVGNLTPCHAEYMLVAPRFHLGRGSIRRIVRCHRIVSYRSRHRYLDLLSGMTTIFNLSCWIIVRYPSDNKRYYMPGTPARPRDWVKAGVLWLAQCTPAEWVLYNPREAITRINQPVYPGLIPNSRAKDHHDYTDQVWVRPCVRC